MISKAFSDTAKIKKRDIDLKKQTKNYDMIWFCPSINHATRYPGLRFSLCFVCLLKSFISVAFGSQCNLIQLIC